MANSWACECGALNYSRVLVCEACGLARPTGTETTHRPAPSREERPACGYLTNGSSCRLPVTFWPDGGHGRCTWHGLVQQHGERIAVPEEFVRWVEQLEREHICCLWTHVSPVSMWNFLTGVREELPAPAACQNPGCSIAPAAASDAEVAAFRAAIRNSRTTTPNADPMMHQEKIAEALAHLGRRV